ncbi:MAG: response regulator [Candidatus Sumerlaeaceae bacterium]|nr:response regulator [Candidatus Sumerlaeaceae bacterium]
MTTTSKAPTATKVLIVDDNKIYRDAFRRNLLLQNYEVLEAEDSEQALKIINEGIPEVVITDLQMRSETEGLDLIQQVKSTYPLLPIIMISAVGTFEEGALAKQFGASSVISKSRIEDEIERLYDAINQARAELDRGRTQDSVIQQAKSLAGDEAAVTGPALESMRVLLADPSAHPYIRSEAYNVFALLNQREIQAEARRQAQSAAGGGIEAPRNLQDIEDILRREIPQYDSFSEDSKDSLRIAEFLYEQQTHTPGSIDFSRNIGFSFCFAVENEAKLRMAKRLQKFLSSDPTYIAVTEMMENNNQNLSIYYHQYLLLLLRTRPMDFTIDNVKQTFRRILEHQSRYKPDGLKALGIMIIAFGRTYSWSKNNKAVKITNPLGIKGIESDDDVLHFAELLISLQHYRNPYIHPEISDLEKLSIIRATAFECLNMASRLQ